ncbi:hypothetical protein QBC39DRAFT_130022 [Podospora conica]|nr:hypothetical protein QBC39DRAFT_130022 [Schizothecium conicum]
MVVECGECQGLVWLGAPRLSHSQSRSEKADRFSRVEHSPTPPTSSRKKTRLFRRRRPCLRGIHFLTVRFCLIRRDSVAAPPDTRPTRDKRKRPDSLASVSTPPTNVAFSSLVLSGGRAVGSATRGPTPRWPASPRPRRSPDLQIADVPTPISWKYAQHSMMRRTGAAFYSKFPSLRRLRWRQVTNCGKKSARASVFRIQNYCRPSFSPCALLPQIPLSSTARR